MTDIDILSSLSLEGLTAVDLHESQDRTGALPGRIKPLMHQWIVAGPALPVAFAAGDNLWLHRALLEALPGEVVVAKPFGPEEAGYWGEIMTVAAIARGIGGLVLDGCVRDRSRLIDLGLPIFCVGLSINGTQKLKDGLGSIGEPITIGDVAIERGDFVYGDEDGVVVVPKARISEVVSAARARKEEELEIIQRIKSGESTLDIYRLPASTGQGLADTGQDLKDVPSVHSLGTRGD